MFTQSQLQYDFNALEPYIDERTMILHYTKHHAGYTRKLNQALEKYPKFFDKSIEQIIENINEIPEEIRQAVINNGGGYYNHELFWKMLTPNKVQIPESLINVINKNFESFEKFKEQFSAKALSLFGSGWVWLIQLPDGKLKIKRNSFQNNPLMKNPNVNILLGLDVWEHAYYLKYQNRRDEYIKNWWNIVNWEYVNDNLVNII